jgi:hypothetical protein
LSLASSEWTPELFFWDSFFFQAELQLSGIPLPGQGGKIYKVPYSNPLSVDKQEGLIQDNSDIDGSHHYQSWHNKSEFTVEAQQNQRNGDNSKFPDPEPIPEELDGRADNGVNLPPTIIQNCHCEQCIQNV